MLVLNDPPPSLPPEPGAAVQVHPRSFRVDCDWFQRLNPNYDALPSTFGFKVNLRHCNLVTESELNDDEEYEAGAHTPFLSTFLRDTLDGLVTKTAQVESKSGRG